MNIDIPAGVTAAIFLSLSLSLSLSIYIYIERRFTKFAIAICDNTPITSKHHVDAWSCKRHPSSYFEVASSSEKTVMHVLRFLLARL